MSEGKRWGKTILATRTSAGNFKPVDPTNLGFESDEELQDLGRAEIKARVREQYEDEDSNVDFGDVRLLQDIGDIGPSETQAMRLKIAELEDKDYHNVEV